MDSLNTNTISDKSLNDLLDEIDKRTLKIIKDYCKSKLEFPYFGIVKECVHSNPNDATSPVTKAKVLLNETGVMTGEILNKTGVQNLQQNDSVVVYAINDSLSNCYIGLKCGE